MKILITSPITDGGVGGPASVARELDTVFSSAGDTVEVVAPTTSEMNFPVGVRQAVLMVRLVPYVRRADVVLVLDPVSTGFSAACVAKLFGKPVVLRIGGDFLWESYVERTQEPVLLSEFYKEPRALARRERMIRALTKRTLSMVHKVVFTTAWQRDIWMKPYGLIESKIAVISNAIPEAKLPACEGTTLLALGRDTRVKNIALLAEVWNRIKHEFPEIQLITGTKSRAGYVEALAHCRGVVQPTLSEVSPNTVLEAIAYGKPFLTTRDNGLFEAYAPYGIFVDTRDEGALEGALRALLARPGQNSHPPERSWATAANEYRTVLQETLGEHS